MYVHKLVAVLSPPAAPSIPSPPPLLVTNTTSSSFTIQQDHHQSQHHPHHCCPALPAPGALAATTWPPMSSSSCAHGSNLCPHSLQHPPSPITVPLGCAQCCPATCHPTVSKNDLCSLAVCYYYCMFSLSYMKNCMLLQGRWCMVRLLSCFTCRRRGPGNKPWISSGEQLHAHLESLLHTQVH